MSCMKRRANNKIKRYKETSVHPHPMASQKVDTNFMDNFLRESMHCGNCRNIFNLGSDELKIHCNICNEFFHCGIAGECIGEDCMIKDERGRYKHRARYCMGCVKEIYNAETCLCKNCGSK